MKKKFHYIKPFMNMAAIALFVFSFILTTQSTTKAAQPMVAAGGFHTVGLKSNGTVVAVGDNYSGQCNVNPWTNIEQVAAGNSHTVGLKSNGMMVAVGWNDYGQCNVGSWTNIEQVAAGWKHTVGLKSNGTVVAVGDNGDGQLNVGSWTNIVQVAAGTEHTVGLKSNGTVVAVGDNTSGELNVSTWTDIVQVSAGYAHTVGLKSDGTVVAVGYNPSGQCNVSPWTDIEQVSAGHDHTVGVKNNGKVVVAGCGYPPFDFGQCNVSSWTNIVQASASIYHTVGLKSNGTVVAVGDNYSGMLNVSDWNLLLFTDVPQGYWAHDYIYRIYNAGITKGCSQNPLKYCPYDPVNRKQMAAFIVRAAEGEPPADYCATGSPFSDVSSNTWPCKYIKRLLELEITKGCGPGIYCPNDPVTRAQMAAFLIRAIEGEPPVDYCDAGSPFTDVSPDTWPCKYIKRLSELGVTKGCGPGVYCPNDPVTRAQMAAFLARAFLEVILSDALYSPVTGHWYQLNDTRMIWSEAKTFAESRGGHLATITSAAEGQWLYDAFGSALRIGSGIRTFGGNDVANEGQWQWVTGETWSYTNWADGEPNDYGGNEDCVALLSDLRPGHGHYWNDVPTDREYRSLIEYDSNPN